MKDKKNWQIALLLVAVTFIVYLTFCQKEYIVLNYFLPLANSILHGKLDINCALPLNELVNSSGKCFVVYPPAPAISLIPFAIFFGDKISQTYPGIIFASLAVGFFYLYLAEVADKKTAILLSVFLAFGTNFFLTSLSGRSWYFAHVCSVLFLAISLLLAQKKQPFWAGLFLSFAGMSRIPVLLAVPAILYILKPKKMDWIKFLAPYAIIIGLYLIYNYFRFGSVFETGYSLIPGVLEEPWYSQGILSLSYIPRNLEVMFSAMPQFIGKFPFVVPSTYAMAIWLVSPALILSAFALKNRLSLVCFLTFWLVMIIDFMHGEVGFSQLGYRFSLDGILLLIIAMIPVVKSRFNLSYVLISLSVFINLFVVFEFTFGLFRP